MEAPPEIYLFSCVWTVPNPHQDSEVNSLWSMVECNQGKSAKPMRNFGRSIGSKGWMIEAQLSGGDKVSGICGCDFGCACGFPVLSNAMLVSPVIANNQLGTVADKGNPTVQLKHSLESCILSSSRTQGASCPVL